MAILENIKHEKFATAVSEGKSQREAAILAGYSPLSADQTASAIAKRPEVKARIIELREHRVERTMEAAVLDDAWIIHQLRDRAVRYTDANPMASNKALELLARHRGLLTDKVEVRSGELDDKSDEDLMRELESLTGKAAYWKAPSPKDTARQVGSQVVDDEGEDESDSENVESQDKID